jgi:hypothetical protein
MPVLADLRQRRNLEVPLRSRAGVVRTVAMGGFTRIVRSAVALAWMLALTVATLLVTFASLCISIARLAWSYRPLVTIPLRAAYRRRRYAEAPFRSAWAYRAPLTRAAADGRHRYGLTLVWALSSIFLGALLGWAIALAQ